MTTITQLKVLGDTMMSGAKTNLTEHGNLIPVVGIVQNGEMRTIVGLEMPQEDKRGSYRKLVAGLRILQPDAVIVVNDAYVRVVSMEALDSYRHGDLSVDHEAKETIIVAFKGPGLVPHIRQTVYARGPLGDIVFKQDGEWLEGPVINILPDWWAS